MQFPGVLRNSMWKFQGLIKKPVEIPRLRKICVKQGSCFSVLEYHGCNMFCLEFPRVK